MANNNNIDDDSDILVTLELDDNRSVECEILTIFEAAGRDYIVLCPLKDNGDRNDDGEVYIYRYHEDEEGNPDLSNIESDEEYEIVSDKFDELLDEAEFEDMKD